MIAFCQVPGMGFAVLTSVPVWGLHSLSSHHRLHCLAHVVHACIHRLHALIYNQFNVVLTFI